MSYQQVFVSASLSCVYHNFLSFFSPRTPDIQQIIRAGEQISVLVDLSKSHVLALFCTLKVIEEPRVSDFEEHVIFVRSSLRAPAYRTRERT